MAVNGGDPFELLSQLCVLSDSQEELLRCCSFAGNPKSAVDVSASASQSLRPNPHPSGVLVPSLPERLEQREQLNPNYAYQPPSEQSTGQHPMAADGPSLRDAAAGDAEATIEGGRMCDVAAGVDLGKNPDLGFPSEVQSQQIETETEIIGGVRRRSIAESEFESESVPVVANLDLGDSNGEEIWCIKKKRKLGYEKMGNSKETRHLDPWRRIQNESKEKTNKDWKENEGNDSEWSVLEILKIVAEKERKEIEEDLGNKNILEIVTDRGMTFPRPCWWPEGEDHFEFK